MRNRLLLLCATLVAFGASLFAGFHFDDYAIFSDPALTSFAGFAHPATLARPHLISDATLLLNQVAGGRDPIGYHLFNLALYLGAALLAYECLRRLVNENAAFAAALIFALHPIQAEAANYISARPVLLGAVLCLTALLAWLAQRQWLAAAVFAVAVLTYPEAAAFPALVAFAAWRPSKVNDAPGRSGIAPLCAMLALSGLALVRLFFSRAASSSVMNYAMAQGVAVWRYLRLLVIPYGFTVDPDVRTPALSLGILAWVAFGAMAFAAWKYRSRTWPAFVLAGMLLLLPGASIFPSPNTAADSRAYLAMFAFSAAIGILIARVPGQALALGLAAVLCLMSLNRTVIWMSDQRLWKEAVRRSPAKARPKVQLSQYLPAGQAIELLQTAANQAPQDPAVAAALGRVLLDERQTEAALTEFGRAITLDPANAQYFNNRGVALAILGDTEGARADFVKALELDPNLTEARTNLGKFPPAQ